MRYLVDAYKSLGWDAEYIEPGLGQPTPAVRATYVDNTYKQQLVLIIHENGTTTVFITNTLGDKDLDGCLMLYEKIWPGFELAHTYCDIVKATKGESTGPTA